ncbi:sensor histidine kinase [Chelatococcus reniformis]|uniref:Blue-light-activated histidine kinase n=1 Tax=Chelatococcus reniformis TaxID=1494448 RepID=A0A916UB07_9HYPH|nr:HWE histidine kinase domain-containing protein [Chelatococcus reniformis]GGC66852.1 hypothetical protein GCM10010994_26780 [Chelatococcus reniformis]
MNESQPDSSAGHEDDGRLRPRRRRGRAPRQKSTSFRRRLLLLVLALTVPALALAAGGFYSAYITQRRATETLLTRTTRALALSVDRDLAVAEASLRTLALSRQLVDGDLRAFHELAARAAPLEGAWLVLSDPAGTPLLSSKQSFGEPVAPDLTPVEAAQLAQTQAAELAFGELMPTPGLWIVKVHLPVLAGGKVAYILSALIPPQTFERLMGEQGLFQSSWVAAVLDDAGRVVMRSRGGDDFVGRPASESLRLALGSQLEGAVTATALDGVPVRSFFSRTPRYGWYFVIGYPLSELSGSLLRSLAWFGALALAIGFGLTYAAFLLRSLLVSVRRLRATAGALGAGTQMALEPTGVAEFDAVERAFADTAGQLHMRNAERDRVLSLLRENEQRLEFALEAGELGTWAFDPRHGVLTGSDRARTIVGLPVDRGLTLKDLSAAVHPDDRDCLQAAIERAMVSRGPFAMDLRVVWPDRSVHWVDVRGLPMARGGAPPLLTGMVQDITERKTAEQRQQLLVSELNHRVKNSLATVQSIAMLTRRSDDRSEDAWDAFERRLIGLAKTHDLLTAESWNGASLASVLANELAPYQDVNSARVTLTGEPTRLNARATLTLGLCVHELATNAAKYGALSVPTGRVDVAWREVESDAGAMLVIDWHESGGPPVAQPTRQGFGSKLLERGLRRELAAEIALDYAAAGLRCTIRLPLVRVMAAARSGEPAAAEARPGGV